MTQVGVMRSVNPPIKNDYHMLAVFDLTSEDAGAALPQYRHAGAPHWGELGGTREHATLRLLRFAYQEKNNRIWMR